MSQLSYDYKKSMQRWWLVLLGVFIIHNLEEILFDMVGWEMTHRLPIWMEAGRNLHTSIQLTPSKFLMIVLVLCVVIGGIAFLLRTRSRASRYGMTAFAVIMLVIYLGHLLTSLYAGSSMPGVYSAVLIGLPVYSFVLYQLWRASARQPV